VDVIVDVVVSASLLLFPPPFVEDDVELFPAGNSFRQFS